MHLLLSSYHLKWVLWYFFRSSVFSVSTVYTIHYTVYSVFSVFSVSTVSTVSKVYTVNTIFLLHWSTEEVTKGKCLWFFLWDFISKISFEIFLVAGDCLFSLYSLYSLCSLQSLYSLYTVYNLYKWSWHLRVDFWAFFIRQMTKIIACKGRPKPGKIMLL